MPWNNRYKKIRDKLPFPKAAYQNFYNRISSWRYTVEQAAYPDKIVKDRRWEARKYYDNYQWDKPEWKTFLSRVKSWRKFQEAIQIWRLGRREIEKPKEIKLVLKKNHKQKQTERYNPENYFIRVTMNTEEAKSYHRTYRSMIAELEDKIYNLEDTSTLSELNKKLEFIKQQYQVFLSFNPI